ncbi:MAG: membrane protein insertase YidC [Elusimicrobia bacterium]|nr:membrane protein insertase YidC [Elusimicrobiota bacterium]
MEKRSFLAIILSIAILVVWQWFFAPKPPVKQPGSIAGTTKESPKNPDTSSISSIPEKTATLNSGSRSRLAKTIEIKTKNIEYILSEDEASIVHCFLMPDVLKSKTTVDLVLDGKLLNDSNTGAWQYLAEKNQPYVARFIKINDGFDIEKTFYFNENSYLVDIEYAVKSKSSSAKDFNGLSLSIGPGLGTDAKELKENKRLTRVSSYSQKKVEKLKPGNYEFPLKWVGIDNRYFLSVFLKINDEFKNISVEEVQKTPVIKVFTDKITFLPHEKKNFSMTAYLGPKGYTHLKGIKVNNLNSELEKAVDFGFFGDLGKIALSSLNYLYKITNNYGLAIIIISVFLNILFFPLSKKSFTSAQAMKSIQGDIKILQAKYKNDPKKMNTETWALYKSKGVNPFSGCLPMLVQLPIFWALFTMLRNAYELRGAHFIFWITDLSAKDPYYILPVLMGGGMYLQQKMTGSTSDPTQKQMMIMMPVIFTIMFLNFPSGLVIYWFTNSIITVVEQWFIFRKVKV